MLGVVRLG